jgi:hypothetical protein
MQQIKNTGALPLVKYPEVLPQKSNLILCTKIPIKFYAVPAALHWDSVAYHCPF